MAKELRERTTLFALRIVRLYSALPKATVAQTPGKQMLRSATSVGAHYREAERAKSDADFISKVEGALQELNETDYWLDLIMRAEIIPASRLQDLRDETNEPTAIFVTIAKRAKGR